MFRNILVQAEDFDVGAEIARTSGVHGDVGAVASFLGLCRNEDGAINGLDIECYPAMAYSEVDAIIDSASGRWELESVTVIHRHGRILTGERIVFVAVAARHRGDAFAAAEYIMDFLKRDAPFWKRELRVVDSLQANCWVAAKPADAEAIARWADTERPCEIGTARG